MKLRFNNTVAAVASSALLLMAVPAVGIATASQAASKPVLVIGYQGPMTGGNAVYGTDEEPGVAVAINKANASGKLPFTLKLKVYDDQGDPTLAPTQAQAAVANKNLVAVVGPAFSGATIASEPYYASNNVAIVSPSATRVSLAYLGYNNFFRVVADDGVQGPADANYVVNTLKAKNLYVVNDGSAYGSGLASAFGGQAKSDGATITTATVLQTTGCSGTASATEYSAAAAQVVAAKPDLMFYGGYSCDLSLFLGALNAAGYTGKVMSGDGSDNVQLVTGTTPNSAANGVYLTCACSSNVPAWFASAYKVASNGIDVSKATYPAESYDAANAIINVLKTLKPASIGKLRSEVVNGLHSISFKGITKTISFEPGGNIAGTAIYVSQVQNGNLKQLGLA